MILSLSDVEKRKKNGGLDNQPTGR
jgi:hypothetical protein